MRVRTRMVVVRRMDMVVRKGMMETRWIKVELTDQLLIQKHLF
jgi:hypothetical protein